MQRDKRDMSQAGISIIRATEILINREAIAEAFGVGIKTVQKWKRKGAPIICDEQGTYRCEKYELWCWVRER